MCLSPILYVITVVLTVMTFSFVVVMWGCILMLKYFPKSNLSEFIRNHIITDEDLEPKD
jgi:hypothetical protein